MPVSHTPTTPLLFFLLDPALLTPNYAAQKEAGVEGGRDGRLLLSANQCLAATHVLASP